MTDDLKDIADQMTELLNHFIKSEMFGLFLPAERVARYRAISGEAQDIIGSELGYVNNYSHAIGMAGASFTDGPSYANVLEAIEMVRAAIRAIERKKRSAPTPPVNAPLYVDHARIAELQAIRGGPYDFTRLIELCREINVTRANHCHMATAMLLRAILDHIPPVFGFRTFAEVANNYGGGTSFKSSIQRLQATSREIGNMHLHAPIRDRESLPTAVQVNFSVELDILLSEAVRISTRKT